MTIPDIVIQLAAEAAATEMLNQPGKVTIASDALSAVNGALPILRAAIRAELVQEMIADAEDNGRAVVTIRSEYEQVPISTWLRTYLSESETQP